MACIMKNKLKGGNVSFTIQVKVKDPKTERVKTKVMTWKKPKDMKDTEARRHVDKLAVQFEEQCIKQIKGLIGDDEQISFEDFANKWLERVKDDTDKSPLYYEKAHHHVKRFIEFFGKIKLKDITPSMVQNFADSLGTHRIVNDTAICKKSMYLLLKSKRLVAKRIREWADVNYGTYAQAQRGLPIKLENAQKICKALNVNYDDYFETKPSSKPYARATKAKYIATLRLILGFAKRQRLIDYNYATGEFIESIKGSKKEIAVLNDEEAKILREELDRTENPRWKIAIYILLLMGIRRGELAGLDWEDIDFKTKTMHIRKSRYLVNRKLITKCPKTETSIRSLAIPQLLVDKLLEYKEWYDKVKEALGDLWQKNTALLVNDEGNIIYPNLYRIWLRKILKKANLNKVVTVHSLRHTNITLMLTSGVDLRTVSARAGHARTSTTTDIYSHFIKNCDERASRIIDDIFTDKKE